MPTDVSKLLKSLDPPIENLTSHFILGEIIDHIENLADDFPDVKLSLLKETLRSIRNQDVDLETHLRSFLRVFEETPGYKDAFAQLDEQTKRQLKVYIAGGNGDHVLAAGPQDGFFHPPPSPPVKDHLWNLVSKAKDVVEEVIEEIEEFIRPAKKMKVNGTKAVDTTSSLPEIYEDAKGTKIMEVYPDREFQNWGQTVRNTPLYTFIPTTVLGLCNLVKWAKIKSYRIRCSGYRHSWSSTFSSEKQILVSLLNLEQVTHLPDAMSIEPEWQDPENELKVIDFNVPDGAKKLKEENKLVRVGVTVTNERFRRWAVDNDAWSLPVDVILVEVTCGGVNGPICHGAGRQHQTVNDYVRAVDYIDANGKHQTITDPIQLTAAAGHFGLLGIVTHLTFELVPMTYAVLQPEKPDIGLAIPPLQREDIPIALRKSFTPEQRSKALAEFEKRAADDYYSEWFWFTRSQQAWVNTWNPTSDKEGSREYPSAADTFNQWVQGWLGAVVTSDPIFSALPGRWQAELLATMSMLALPSFSTSSYPTSSSSGTQNDGSASPQGSTKTALPNALHFRRGIQNMRVRDMEFQIPIPGRADDPSKPDFDVVRRAWWDVINLTYEEVDTPMRLTMELRIMGDSKLLLAPQHGNTHGTASIEVLSIPDAVTDDEWAGFIQKVADLWMGYVDPATGKPLNVRPHWAKEWEGVEMRGQPAIKYLRREEVYGARIREWKEVVQGIGRKQGWTLDDIKRRFSNELWNKIIFDEGAGESEDGS